MKPTPSDVHVNAPLSNISVAYIQSADSFIADKVFPNIPVSKQSDRYFTYDRGEFNRDEMQLRAPATESAGGSYTIDSTPTYFCNEWSLHKDVPDQVRSNADDAINPDREATEWVTLKALIRREKIWVNSFFRTGVWSTDIAGVASGPTAGQTLKWNNDNSDPIKAVRDYKRQMRESTGFEVNTMTIGRAVYDALVDHPDVVDRLKYGQTPGAPAKGSQSALQDLFEIEKILVMNAVENIAAEGAAPNHKFIGGNKLLLSHSAKTPGLMTPSAGYTFSWTGMYGGSKNGTRIRQFRMENLKADRVEIDLCIDEKLVAADLGILISDLT